MHVSISMWDMASDANQRADIRAAHIRRDGFEIVFTTWEDTRVARIRADWMAIGALPMMMTGMSTEPARLSSVQNDDPAMLRLVLGFDMDGDIGIRHRL